jgi:hypothetical protein
MTHRALKISAQLQAVLSEHIRDGKLVPPLPPVPRDGLAALSCWRAAGQPVERIRLDDVVPIPQDLRLALHPIPRPGVGYILPERHDWIILGRVGADQPITVAAGISYAFPDPMLVWLGWRGAGRRSIFAGHVNLAHHTTVAGLRLSIDQDAADEDLLSVGMCLPRFFGM